MPEPTELDVRAVRRGALAILGSVVFAIVAAWLLSRFLGPAANTPSLAIGAAGGPAPPRLQSSPQPDRVAYTAEKARLLSGYAWVDRQAGIGRIPLEEAMRLLAGQGRTGTAIPGGQPPVAVPHAGTTAERASESHVNPYALPGAMHGEMRR